MPMFNDPLLGKRMVEAALRRGSPDCFVPVTKATVIPAGVVTSCWINPPRRNQMDEQKADYLVAMASAPSGPTGAIELGSQEYWARQLRLWKADGAPIPVSKMPDTGSTSEGLAGKAEEVMKGIVNGELSRQKVKQIGDAVAERTKKDGQSDALGGAIGRSNRHGSFMGRRLPHSD